MDKIFVLRLGSLTNSNILSSVLAFTYLSAKNSVMPSILALPAYFVHTMYVYLMDIFRWGNIEQYKLGNKTTDEFVKFLRTHFIGTRDEVLDAWNASVGINAETIDRDSKKIDDVVLFADEHPSTKVIIVSGTNEAHLDYIKSLCGKFV